MPPTPFQELQRISEESGLEKALDFLEHHFRRDKSYFKLFEVLKMRCRNRLKLPLIYTQQPDDLDESEQRKLEDGLLDACREIGTLFFKSGQFQEGWMYLQPVGDKELSDKLVRSITPDEENIDGLIDVTITQGAAPGYGFRLLLNHYGTCNGITTFDTQAGRFDLATQKQMAHELLNHIYKELTENVRNAVQKNGEELAAEPLGSLGELMDSIPHLTDGGAHHIDTTHLASLMRIARAVDEPADLKKVSELARYGSHLHEDFQYPGSPPFEDTYVDYGFYYNALLGHDVDAAIAHFENKTKTHDADQVGPIAEETLVDLLVRLGRNDEAVTIMTERLLGKHEPLGIAPQPFEVANTPETRARMKAFYETQEDLLGFAVSILAK